MNLVFGEGNPDAYLMCVAESPGQEEDETGRPLVGRAGRLFTGILEFSGLKREEVYITNILKCRPTNNRLPEPAEIQLCTQYLKKQISIIYPKFIIGMGATACKWLLNDPYFAITKQRGIIKKYEVEPALDILVMPTFHPSYLLRTGASDINSKSENLSKVKEDFVKVVEFIGLLKQDTKGAKE
jgi:DNA polymerase